MNCLIHFDIYSYILAVVNSFGWQVNVAAMAHVAVTMDSLYAIRVYEGRFLNHSRSRTLRNVM